MSLLNAIETEAQPQIKAAAVGKRRRHVLDLDDFSQQ